MNLCMVDEKHVEVLIGEIKAPLFDAYSDGKRMPTKRLAGFLSEATRRTGILYALHSLHLVSDESMGMLEDYLKFELDKVKPGFL